MGTTAKQFNKMIANNVTFKQTQLSADPAFKSLVSTGYSMQLKGIIDNVILKDDVVFAVVRRDHQDLMGGSFTDEGFIHGHDGFFNSYSYENINGLTLAELAIPTDITPVSSIISRYIGRPVTVTVQNNRAIFASVLQSSMTLTTIEPTKIRQVRDKLLSMGEPDIFSKAAEKVWKLFEVTQEEVKSLQGLIYNEEELSNKFVTFEGEGNWNKDIAPPAHNEVQLAPSPIIPGLNGLGMKTNKCHAPTRIFSAK